MSEKTLKTIDVQDESTEFLLYNVSDEEVKVQVILKDETIWLTQQNMADLFGIDRTGISRHLKSIFESDELLEEVVCAEIAHTTQHGAISGKTQTQATKYYNLEAIISVGYRVNSAEATKFRKWATTIISEYIIKGFAMDDERLKQPEPWDYFDEWLERIREIRASEKRFYQKVRDIYVTAIDYDSKSEHAQTFFKKVQNKMLWAVTGKTAAELIADRSGSNKPNMGLASFKGSIVRKGDVGIAKNYLEENEIEELNRIVTMYLDYAEGQAKKRKPITMEQWSDKLDAFLEFNDKDLLTHPGSLTMQVAQKIAEERYEEFNIERKRMEAIAADEEDIEALEDLEKKLTKGNGGDHG